jgi:hypothetical protein
MTTMGRANFIDHRMCAKQLDEQAKEQINRRHPTQNFTRQWHCLLDFMDVKPGLLQKALQSDD